MGEEAYNDEAKPFPYNDELGWAYNDEAKPLELGCETNRGDQAMREPCGLLGK